MPDISLAHGKMFGIVLLSCISGLVAGVGLSLIFAASLLWRTRAEALPGSYRVTTVQGSSTLTLRPDHTFTQEVRFMEYDKPEVFPYRQHPTRYEVISGRWKQLGRDGFDQRILLTQLMSLAPWDEGKIYNNFEASYGPVALTGLGIEVDLGANIVYRK